MNNFRQGDVALISIERIPEVKLEKTHNTLAYGEVSGHHHTLYGDVEVLRDCDTNETYVKVGEKGAEIRHDDTHKTVNGQHPIAEHFPIQIFPGAYKLRHQREHVLFSSGNAERLVID